MNYNIPSISNYQTYDTIQLSSFNVDVTDWEHQEEEREETMNTEVRDQRYHLNNRLNNLVCTHDRALQKAFHINNTRPATFKEAVEKLRTGKFSLDEKYISRVFDDYGEDFDAETLLILNAIDWDMEPANKEGYKTAHAEMEKASRIVYDDIAILEPEKALASLREFEAKTFH